jgi:O-antigen ligase
LLPTQLGKHLWPDFTIVSGIRIDYLSPTLYSSDILLILLIVVFLIRERRKFQIAKYINRKRLIFGGTFFLFVACNIAFSLRPLLSFYGFLKLLEFAFIVTYLAKTIVKLIQLQIIVLPFAVGSLFESLLSLLQYLNQGSLNGIFYYLGERTFTGVTPGIANVSLGGSLILRPYATFPHPNVLAGYLLVAMILVWNFLLSQKKLWIKVFAMVQLFVCTIALLLTFSRIAILLWGVLVLVIVVRMSIRLIKTNQVKLLMSYLVLISFIIIWMLPLTHEVIVRFSQTSFFEESVIERTELLHASWLMIQQHPLVGVGLDNFIPSLASLQEPRPLGLYLQPVHTIFVLIAAETGVIGLVLFIGFIIATGVRIKNQERRIKGVLITLFFIIIVTGLFDHYWLTLQQGQLLFATVLGLSWASYVSDKKNI